MQSWDITSCISSYTAGYRCARQHCLSMPHTKHKKLTMLFKKINHDIDHNGDDDALLLVFNLIKQNIEHFVQTMQINSADDFVENIEKGEFVWQ
jgi:hypothetical protein